MTAIKKITTLNQLHAYQEKNRPRSIGFVPTMGNLHSGHLALVHEVAKYCDEIIVSIFVNPKQFAPNEDYDTYPRTLANDIELLSNTDCSTIFTPDVNTIYAHEKPSYQLANYPEIEKLSMMLCGLSRPHFFYGVVDVVCRLFEIIQPDYACFGEKDYQQLRIVSEISKKLFPSIKVLSTEIQRSESQLALSSRNTYLTKEQLITASLLASKMQETIAQLANHSSTQQIEKKWQTIINQAIFSLQKDFEMDYFEVRRNDNLQLIASANELHADRMDALTNCRLFAAAYYNGVRLIDNWILSAK